MTDASDDIETASQRMLSVAWPQTVLSLPDDDEPSDESFALAPAMQIIFSTDSFRSIPDPSGDSRAACYASSLMSREYRLLSSAPISCLYGPPLIETGALVLDIPVSGLEPAAVVEVKSNQGNDDWLALFLRVLESNGYASSSQITILEPTSEWNKVLATSRAVSLALRAMLDEQRPQVARSEALTDAAELRAVEAAEAAEAAEQRRLRDGIEDAYAAERAALDFLPDE